MNQTIMESVHIEKEELCLEEFRQWGDTGDQPGQKKDIVTVSIFTGHKFQKVEGIGAAFSEIGGKALVALSPEKQEEVLADLYSPQKGAGLNYCRLHIGSSDFGLDAYSYDDIDNDYGMDSFSIERDRKYYLPFIKGALKQNLDIHFHASPWSPPAWMKTNSSMVNGGSLKNDPNVYQAYATYFRKYVQSYASEGIPIHRLLIQNEVDVATIYPSCVMEPKQMTHFAKEYLLPELRKHQITTEVWAGTFRTVNTVKMSDCLADSDFKDVYSGIGLQYTQIQQLLDIQKMYPGTKFMHTESVCYNGNNSWEQAINLFNDFCAYMNAGCSVYTYWNTILETGGKSTWGWAQNSLVTIDTKEKEVTYNPDYYIMKLLATKIRPGARRIGALCISKKCIAFENMDGSIVLLISNLNSNLVECRVNVDGLETKYELQPMSIQAIEI